MSSGGRLNEDTALNDSAPATPAAPAISAHRGGVEGGRPGSYEAYRHALTAGAEYIEFDVRRTLDGKHVTYHHARSPRARAVGAVSYQRLCRLAGYRVPLAAEVMRLVAGRAVGHLDLKEPGDAEAVVGQAVDILGPGGFVVTTGNEAVAAEIGRDFPAVLVALTISGDLGETVRFHAQRSRRPGLTRLDRVLACQVGWAAVHHRLAATGILAECRRRGIKTMVWTVNSDTALARWLTDPDTDVVVTDRPARAAAMRGRLDSPFSPAGPVSAR